MKTLKTPLNPKLKSQELEAGPEIKIKDDARQTESLPEITSMKYIQQLCLPTIMTFSDLHQHKPACLCKSTEQT